MSAKVFPRRMAHWRPFVDAIGIRIPPVTYADLTPRQQQVVLGMCEDCRMGDVADALEISRKTVDTYRKQIYERLHVQSRAGIVLWAIRNGVIQP